MSGWNYRVIRKKIERSDDYMYGIHEVWYDDNDQIDGWTDEIAPYGESFLELKNNLNYMIKATQKPILEEKEIDGELKLVEISK